MYSVSTFILALIVTLLNFDIFFCFPFFSEMTNFLLKIWNEVQNKPFGAFKTYPIDFTNIFILCFKFFELKTIKKNIYA